MKKINNLTKKWVKDLNRHLSKDDVKWLTSIWKDARCYYQRNVSPNHNEIISHPFGWLLLNKNEIEDKKSWQEWRKIGSLVQYGWGCKVAELLWKIVWWFLKKLKIELPYDPTTLEEAMQPIPVFLHSESHGQRNLVGYTAWSCEESGTTE